MRVTTSSVPFQAQTVSNREKIASTHNNFSTLASAKEFEDKPTKNLISIIYHKILSVFKWIWSFFTGKKNESKEAPQVEFSNIITGEKGKIRYRLLSQGKSTENKLTIGERSAFIEEITFPDEDLKSHLKEMIPHIMKEEKVECLVTSNPKFAKYLVDADLYTENGIEFYPKEKSHLNTFIETLLTKAFQERKKLSSEGKKALARIEGGIIISILCNGTQRTDSVKDYMLRTLGYYQNYFPGFNRENGLKIAAKYGKEHELGSWFDQQLEDLKNWLKGVSFTRMRHIKISDEEGFAIGVSDFFTLLEETDSKIDKNLIHVFPTMRFYKGES